MLLSPLGERLGEGGDAGDSRRVATPSPNLSPKGERNMKELPSVALLLILATLVFLGGAAIGAPGEDQGDQRTGDSHDHGY
jgi:hypothetical protein